MDKNRKSPIQFTQLTPDDVEIHQGVYLSLLMQNRSRSIADKGNELFKAKILFRNTFKTN